ncbi:3382_t:CDS:10 [Entrophospora sp. SA101]|nr:3382_t:CDS:10 [Entrophospora sp. SA101]
MKHKTQWSLSLISPILFFILITNSFAEYQPHDNKLKETLTIKPLSDGKLLTHFQFSVRLNSVVEGKKFNHYNFFPRAIGQIIQSFNVRELHLTFTQGRWNYEDWGYPLSPSAGTGLFCASLNFIDDTITVQPRLSFRPEGFYNDTELSERAELRYGSLPHENVCTENLTPWIKLLPCKSMSGIASLLNGHKLYDSNFHSMSIHVKPICEDLKCANKSLEIVLALSTVVDPVRNSGKRESKLELILPENGDYKITPESNDVVRRRNEGESNIRNIAIYNLKNALLDNELSMTWNEETFEYNIDSIQPRVFAHRYFTGYGQERGGIKVNIFNKSPKYSVPVIYYDVIPWYLKLYLHTLKVQVNGKDSVEGGDNPIKVLYYQPAVDRSRPNVIEAKLLLLPNSLTTLSINFDKVFLKYTEHPPDANRGFDIGSAVLSTSTDTKTNELNNLNNIRNCTLNTRDSCNNNFSIRIYTETLLVSLPTPDFSMPYNVITLTCTVIALFFGSKFR